MTQKDIELYWKAKTEKAPGTDLMQEALFRYVVYGLQPGHFLTSVLQNRFCEAVFYADGNNRLLLLEWARWVYNELPITIWETPEKVKNWIKKGGMVGFYRESGELEEAA